MMKIRIGFLIASAILLTNCSGNNRSGERWSVEKANNWYEGTPWLVGANYVPSTAVNPIEMWQASTFDTATIERELQWASELGFNSMRVFLHNTVWEKDKESYLDRIDKYLEISDRNGISTMLVLFDAVWNPLALAGPQPEPVPHRHNSQWVQSPGAEQLKDTANYDMLEQYVKAVIKHFKDDSRVVVWDIYNEPDNDNSGKYPDDELVNKQDFTFFLLKKAFQWAREINPSQPLTSAVWWGHWGIDKLHENRFNVYQLENSDVISFHNYSDKNEFIQRVNSLERYNRPLICTEYMARPLKNTFQEILPIMKERKISAYNWGFVEGRSQTNYPWDSWDSVYVSEPEIWFHDVLRKDGKPYSEEEAEFLRGILKQ